MSAISQLKSRLTAYRPGDVPTAEIARLAKLASSWLERLESTLRNISAETFRLTKDHRLALALAMTEMADDLHADSGIWRALESCNTSLFGTPLPGLWRPTDAPLSRFDAHRFQFFLEGVWRFFLPEAFVSPRHVGFVAVAKEAEAFFTAKLVGPATGPNSVTRFLDAENTFGWQVKRKLVWFGISSFLLRLAYTSYADAQEKQTDDPQNVTIKDNFLCEECTTWSGLGALELLAERLGLPASDRADLLGWHARHAALYRADTVSTDGDSVVGMSVQNLINDQPYRVRIDQARVRFPFKVGNLISGNLVSWRGEWYWSGNYRLWNSAPPNLASIRREFIQRNARITYRYCPDRAAKARESLAQQHEDFVRFHGTDLAVFKDGLTMAAAEQQRMREYNQNRAAALDASYDEKDYVKNGPQMPYPKAIIDCQLGVAVFSEPVEGTAIFQEFDFVCDALRAHETPLPYDQASSLQGFIESPVVSPAFVRRAIELYSSAGLSALYYLPPGDDVALEHLLRRHKGAFYRPRQPDLTLLED